MKRRISDLLDGYLDDTVNLEAAAPLSSQRIKERTMSKIEYKEKSKKQGRRILFKILVAAAAISMLTVTAAAAERVFGVGDWFRDILNAQAKEDAAIVQQEAPNITLRETVKDNQLQKLEELGQVKNESVTSEGTTMTLTALYSDEYAMHLYFQVVGPEGTVLPDGIHYAINSHDNGYPIDVERDKHVSNLTIETEALPDSDPTDNKKDIHVSIFSPAFGYSEPIEGDSRLNDAVPKKLHISGIYEQVADVNGDEDGFERLVPGEFTFDITNPVTVSRTEADVSGAAYGGHTVRQWTHEGTSHGPYCIPESEKEAHVGDYDYAAYDENGLHTKENDYSVTPSYLSVGPLTAEWKCSFTSADPNASYGMSLKVVMKDGTSAVGFDHGGLFGDDWSAGVYFFSAPIDLEEVDYILIGDESINSTHKVYLNQ